MENLKTYNQILIAVTGTLFFIFLVFSMISFGGILFSFLSGSKNSSTSPVKENNDSEVGKKAIIIDQLESLSNSYYDYETSTYPNMYLIPISSKEPPQEEELFDFSLDEDLDTYHNLALYYPDSGTSKILFDYPVCLKSRILATSASTPSVFFIGASKDTDENGKIDASDKSEIFMLELNSQEVRKLTNEKYDFLDFLYQGDPEDVWVKARMDQNFDKKFEEGIDPEILLQFDFESSQFKPLISEGNLKKLANLLQ